MDIIYNKMITNNLQKINEFGFNYDSKLQCEIDDRYCLAVFSIPTIDNTYFTETFYELQQMLSNENGITYYIDNKEYFDKGTFHFTFIQQLSFNNYYELDKNISYKCYEILNNILKSHLPFKINYDTLIAVTNGFVLCSTNTNIMINDLREEYRNECKKNNLPLIEPYYLDIIHSTIFRFTNKLTLEESQEFLNKYKYYLKNKLPYGYIVIDKFNFGSATWKLNDNEIKINYTIKNDITDST